MSTKRKRGPPVEPPRLDPIPIMPNVRDDSDFWNEIQKSSDDQCVKEERQHKFQRVAVFDGNITWSLVDQMVSNPSYFEAKKSAVLKACTAYDLATKALHLLAQKLKEEDVETCNE